MRQALVVALAVLLAAGCGQAAPSPSSSTSSTSLAAASGPTRICDTIQEAEPPPFSCTDVIRRVLLKLGPEAPFIRAAWFRPGTPCPPNARCIAPPPGSAYVVVRLENGRAAIVRVTFQGDELAVGEPEEPTFDVWPASGEAIPAVGRPDTAPGAPPELVEREPLPLCGEELQGGFDRVARACFFGAVLDGRPAELVTRRVSESGELHLDIFRFAGRGPVVVYVAPIPPEPGWLRGECAIGPAFDDEIIFVIAECLSTEPS